MTRAERLQAVIRSAEETIRLAREAFDDEDDDELLPVAVAAEERHVSIRALTDARRAGELTMFGKQRSRLVRRGDVKNWIASRRVRSVGVDDQDIERRMLRLARSA